jgi:hypothetical protein
MSAQKGTLRPLLPRFQVAGAFDTKVNLDQHAWKENKKNMQATSG